MQPFQSTLDNYINDIMQSSHLLSLVLSLSEQQFGWVAFVASTHKYTSPAVLVITFPCDQLCYLSELLSLVPYMLQHAHQAANLEFILII